MSTGRQPSDPGDTPEQPPGQPQYITIQPAVEHDTAMPLRVVVMPSVVIAYAVVTGDHYHLPADHKDFIAYGTELALILTLIFVGGKLVAGRRLGSGPCDPDDER